MTAMSPVLARYYAIDPAVRNGAIAVLAAVVALAQGLGLWFSFRNRGK